MDKSSFLETIRRMARENGGTPPGASQFSSATHTRRSDWENKDWNNWNNWGDVLEEAGFSRLVATSKFDQSRILKQLAILTSKPGKFPVTLDMRREKRHNPALIEFCTSEQEFAHLLPILTNTTLTVGFKKATASDPDLGNNDTNTNGFGMCTS